MRLRRCPAAFVLALFIFSALPAAAQTLAAGPRQEIQDLLARLQSSACQFNRNGVWYSAEEARSHLLRKFDYLEGKNAVQSAEEFIERGASGSSASGAPYLVRCGNANPVQSKTWLLEQLQGLRTTRTSPGK